MINLLMHTARDAYPQANAEVLLETWSQRNFSRSQNIKHLIAFLIDMDCWKVRRRTKSSLSSCSLCFSTFLNNRREQVCNPSLSSSQKLKKLYEMEALNQTSPCSLSHRDGVAEAAVGVAEDMSAYTQHWAITSMNQSSFKFFYTASLRKYLGRTRREKNIQLSML